MTEEEKIAIYEVLHAIVTALKYHLVEYAPDPRGALDHALFVLEKRLGAQ